MLAGGGIGDAPVDGVSEGMMKCKERFHSWWPCGKLKRNGREVSRGRG
jgi:hypothetical protein